MSSQKKEKKKTKDRSSAEKEKPSPKSKLDYNSKEVEDATIIFQSSIRSYVDAAALKRLSKFVFSSTIDEITRYPHSDNFRIHD
jgi:hypothetical protein